jgi:hypothetical protein
MGESGVFDWSCIELAARGDYTGTLAEWPFLAAALARRGYLLSLGTPAQEIIALCRQLIDEECRA